MNRLISDIEDRIEDLVSNLLTHDRECDEDVPEGAIEDVIRKGIITKGQIVKKFEEALETAIGGIKPEPQTPTTAEQELRNKLLGIIQKVIPTTELHESTAGWIDDLDFLEIVINIERDLGCTINETETYIKQLESVDKLVDWLVQNINFTK